MYVPEAQTTTFMWNTVLVRADGDPRAIVPAIRTVLKSIDPLAPLTSVETLNDRGWIRAEWGTSENNRRARFYALAAAGRKQLQVETSRWERLAEAVARVMRHAED